MIKIELLVNDKNICPDFVIRTETKYVAFNIGLLSKDHIMLFKLIKESIDKVQQEDEIPETD